MKHTVPILLALCLALPVCTGCARPDDPSIGEDLSTDSQAVTTTEAITEEESAEAVPELEFGPLLNNLDFAELAQRTDGQAYVSAVYDTFLDSVNQNPEQVLHDGEAGNYFRVLMSASGEKRHNIMLKITNTEQKKWTYLLVSTEDDFALVAQDAKKKNSYAVGFINGGFTDRLNYTDEADRELLADMIDAQGYDAVLNQVRDEFFGQLSKLTDDEEKGYKLGFTGKIHNMWSEDKTLNPPADRDYTMSEIQLVNAEDISEVFTVMEAIYDIPKDQMDPILAGNEDKGSVGRVAE